MVPELVQADCTPERIAAELLRYLEDPEHRRAVRRELAGVRASLGDPGAFERAARAVLEEA